MFNVKVVIGASINNHQRAGPVFMFQDVVLHEVTESCQRSICNSI